MKGTTTMITIYGNQVSRSELSTDVRTPARAGRCWQGVPHRVLADTLVSKIEARRINILEEKWALDRKGNALVGAFELQLPDVPEIPGQRFALGIRHANDLSRALQINCGTTILVCSNGLITGSFVLKRKHTTGLNLETELEEGVSRYLDEARFVPDIIEALQEKRLSPREIDQALMEAGRKHLLPWSAIGKVDEGYRKPVIAEFARWHGRAWGLYNSFNEAVKQIAPARQLSALNDFRELILN
jgi:hypothetical protein